MIVFYFHFPTLEPMCILVEYAPYGDLLGYLRARRPANDICGNRSIEDTMIVRKRRLNCFSQDIADGMDFLAKHKV